MKTKITIAIFACCAGILIGWFISGAQSSRQAENYTSQSSRQAVNKITQPSVRQDGSERIRTVAPPDTATPPADESPDLDKKEAVTPPEQTQIWNDPEKMAEFKAALEQRTTLQQRATQIADEARQTVIDTAKLNETQITVLDEIIDDLNQNMEDVANKWFERINENKALTSSDRTRMAHDISGVLVDVSDALDEQLPNWRDAGMEPRQLMRHSALAALLRLRMTGGGIQPGDTDNENNQ